MSFIIVQMLVLLSFEHNPWIGLALLQFLIHAVLYRESIIIGETSLSREEVHELVTKMGEEYKGNLYHLLQRNCNHFSEDFAYRLCHAKTPNWVQLILNTLVHYNMVHTRKLCTCGSPKSWKDSGVESLDRVILMRWCRYADTLIAWSSANQHDCITLRILPMLAYMSFDSAASIAARDLEKCELVHPFVLLS